MFSLNALILCHLGWKKLRMILSRPLKINGLRKNWLILIRGGNGILFIVIVNANLHINIPSLESGTNSLKKIIVIFKGKKMKKLLAIERKVYEIIPETGSYQVYDDGD